MTGICQAAAASDREKQWSGLILRQDSYIMTEDSGLAQENGQTRIWAEEKAGSSEGRLR